MFADAAKSGRSTAGREALDEMLRAIECGQIDIVIIEDVARISRDMADSATIFKRLEYARVPMIGMIDGVTSYRPRNRSSTSGEKSRAVGCVAAPRSAVSEKAKPA